MQVFGTHRSNATPGAEHRPLTSAEPSTPNRASSSHVPLSSDDGPHNSVPLDDLPTNRGSGTIMREVEVENLQ